MAFGYVKGRGESRRVRGECAESLGRDRGASLAEVRFLGCFSVTLGVPWSSKDTLQATFSGSFGPGFRTNWQSLVSFWGVSFLCLWGSPFELKDRFEKVSVLSGSFRTATYSRESGKE